MLSVVHIVRRSRGGDERALWRAIASLARAASPADADAIARIYNQGLADRVGTFETEPRSAQQIEAWFDGGHPIVVVEERREVVAFASTSSYRARPCYAGIAEFSVYVARHRRGAGAGQVAMTALLEAAEAAGLASGRVSIPLRAHARASETDRMMLSNRDRRDEN